MRISKRSPAKLFEVVISPFDDPLFPSRLITQVALGTGTAACASAVPCRSNRLINQCGLLEAADQCPMGNEICILIIAKENDKKIGTMVPWCY